MDPASLCDGNVPLACHAKSSWTVWTAPVLIIRDTAMQEMQKAFHDVHEIFPTLFGVEKNVYEMDDRFP
jgi:hypothetical protein